MLKAMQLGLKNASSAHAYLLSFSLARCKTKILREHTQAHTCICNKTKKTGKKTIKDELLTCKLNTKVNYTVKINIH